MARSKALLEKDEIRGPSWDDVREHLRLASRATGRVWYILMTQEPGTATRKPRVRWQVTATRSATVAWRSDDKHRWSHWPSNGHKTVPGLLVRLIHELRANWEEEAQATQDSLPF